MPLLSIGLGETGAEHLRETLISRSRDGLKVAQERLGCSRRLIDFPVCVLTLRKESLYFQPTKRVCYLSQWDRPLGGWDQPHAISSTEHRAGNDRGGVSYPMPPA
jgi:hypothetical protein